MNERIKELEKQAYTEVEHELGGTYKAFNREKFAELLVKECMRLTRWKDFEMSSEQRIRVAVCYDIKEHFGVED